MIGQNDFEEYVKKITNTIYIYKAKVDKVNDDHTINAKLYEGQTETDKILANVKVPFVFGLNDKEEQDCLIAVVTGDITNSFVIAFFSDTYRLHIKLNKTKIELKDDILTLNIKDKTNIEIKEEKITAKTTKSKMILDDKIELGTTKSLKDLFDDVWAGIEAVNDNIGNLSTSLSGLVVTGQASLVDGHDAIFEPLNVDTVATIKNKKANYGLVLK